MKGVPAVRLPKGKGKDWTRPYHVCKGQGCNCWCWALQVPTHPSAVSVVSSGPGCSLNPAHSQQDSRNLRDRRGPGEGGTLTLPTRGFLKVLKKRLAELGEATQEALRAAGFRPKPAPPVEDSLLCRLLSRQGDLPADIQLMLESEAEKPLATPNEEGQHSSNAKEQNQSQGE